MSRAETALAKINATLRNYEEYDQMRRNLQHSERIWEFGHDLGKMFVETWEDFEVEGTDDYVRVVESFKACRDRVDNVMGWEAAHAFGREIEDLFSRFAAQLAADKTDGDLGALA